MFILLWFILSCIYFIVIYVCVIYGIYIICVMELTLLSLLFRVVRKVDNWKCLRTCVSLRGILFISGYEGIPFWVRGMCNIFLIIIIIFRRYFVRCYLKISVLHLDLLSPAAFVVYKYYNIAQNTSAIVSLSCGLPH